MSVRELFRKKLEGADIIPDPSVNAKLMRTLARKEFIRFNPARFNAYYLGVILVASVFTGILLLSDNKTSNIVNKPVDTVETVTQGNNMYLEIQAGAILSKDPAESPDTRITLDNKKKPSDRALISQDEKTLFVEKRVSNIIVPAGINESLNKNGLFNESGADSRKLQTRMQGPDDLFEPSVQSGCVPLKIHFKSNLNSNDSCSWTFGDGGESSQRNPDWIFDLDGEYRVVLNVYSEGLLKVSSSKVITVYPKPHARFEIVPEKAVLPDDEIRFLNYSNNSIKFNWSFGDGTFSDLFEPAHKYSKYSTYNVRLVVTSEYGCKDSLIVLNAFSGSEYFIDFPNAFIPNTGGPSGGVSSNKSDEAVQVFHPTFSGVSDYQLRIFSKIGMLIFESNDVNIGWDGYFKGQLSNSGVYIWKVRGSFRNGEQFIKMGDVTLLKN